MQIISDHQAYRDALQVTALHRRIRKLRHLLWAALADATLMTLLALWGWLR